MRTLFAASILSLISTVALAETSPVKGEVMKINESQSKITLKHGPITNLDMDSMTMVFAVSDPVVLKSLKVGDKVTFEADRVNGRLTVVRLTPSK